MKIFYNVQHKIIAKLYRLAVNKSAKATIKCLVCTCVPASIGNGTVEVNGQIYITLHHIEFCEK